MSKPRLLITHSLLNSWDYLYRAPEEYYDTAYDSFVQTLNRVETPPTQPMLNGRSFERLVTEILYGNDELNYPQEWIPGATEIANIITKDCILEQIKAHKDATINGIDYLLFGVLDWLGSGVIYDIKFKQNLGNYSVGDYYDGIQHRMYFALIDEADTFIYLISNGQKVYRETYTRQECNPIEQSIINLENWLKLCNLWDTYIEKWQAK